MTDFQEVAVKEILRSILGKTANISLYGREHRTPMTFVLDEVEQQIGARFSVYWVDDGSPEVFTLPDFLPSPVVFSARYLALTAIMRSLLVNGLLKNVLVVGCRRFHAQTHGGDGTAIWRSKLRRSRLCQGM